MAKVIKSIREKGKLKLSEYFKKLNIGDRVMVVNEPSVPHSFPNRIVGKTATIIEERGRLKVVQLLDGKALKKFIIHPIHLKKIK